VFINTGAILASRRRRRLLQHVVGVRAAVSASGFGHFGNLPRNAILGTSFSDVACR